MQGTMEWPPRWGHLVFSARAGGNCGILRYTCQGKVIPQSELDLWCGLAVKRQSSEGIYVPNIPANTSRLVTRLGPGRLNRLTPSAT
jgi:hypothetical protein